MHEPALTGIELRVTVNNNRFHCSRTQPQEATNKASIVPFCSNAFQKFFINRRPNQVDSSTLYHFNI